MVEKNATEQTVLKNTEHLNVVWLKRDLRLSDHEPLANALKSGKTLLYYAFEPELIADAHYDERHWRFVLQSIEDINQQLLAFNAKVYVYLGDAIKGLIEINEHFTIKYLFSHQEIGLLNTFNRDKLVKNWCDQKHIAWQETPSGGVLRGKRNRYNWDDNWQKVMRAKLVQPTLTSESLLALKALQVLKTTPLPESWSNPNQFMLTGGESWAKKILFSFLSDRGKDYHFNISKPLQSRKSCSRISPYLAWGNISLRQLYQQLLLKRSQKGWQKPINALASRLHWHCHFIQKFESEHQMQWRPVNKAYSQLIYPEVHCMQPVETRLQCWKTAQTGYPLVDACMLCLIKTGYLNFRMRAMLVSFLCHHLLVDWRLGAAYLASLFLDFEPGIHYPQFQMQSGVTGTNVIRVYNPVKQSTDKDPNAEFICQWLPQLAELPKEIVHSPWLLSPMEQQFYQFELGKDYPHPMIDIEITGKIARDLLWGFRKRADSKSEGRRIVAKHVRTASSAKKKKNR